MLGWDHMMGGAVYGGGLLSLLILGALVYGAVLLVRNSGDDSGSRTESATHNPSAQRPAALEILETRYAKGEIDKEEFESRREVLERSAPQ